MPPFRSEIHRLFLNKKKSSEMRDFKAFSEVDLKGIEPSNLTDANRALSQLSYKPLSAACIL